jgi:hypothetical protein
MLHFSSLILLTAGATGENATTRLFTYRTFHSRASTSLRPEDRSLERDANLWSRDNPDPIRELPITSARRLRDHVGDVSVGDASTAPDASNLQWRGSHPQVYDPASTTPSQWYLGTVSQPLGEQLYQGSTVVLLADSASGWAMTAAGQSASHDESEVTQRPDHYQQLAFLIHNQPRTSCR